MPVTRPIIARPDAVHRVHVVGSGPRSGTTLLHALLTAGFHVDAFDDHEKSVFDPPPTPCAVYASKRPRDALVTRRILEIDPTLWILHIVRDPRDVVVSRHAVRPEHYWTNLRVWKTYQAAARRAAGSPRFHMLRYEDLVRDPDGIQDEIARFLPFLERTHRFSRFHRHVRTSPAANTALGGLRPIDSRSIGSWRSDLPRLAAQLELHGPIQRALVELRYEQDDRWQARLSNTAPSNGTSRMPEFLSVSERIAQWRRRRKQLRRHARLRRITAHGDGEPPRYRFAERREDS